MTIQDTYTSLSPAEVIAKARAFFPFAASPAASFPERGDSGFVRLRLEVGEIVIGAFRHDGATRVRASASRAGALLSSFLCTLAAPETVRRAVLRAGDRR